MGQKRDNEHGRKERAQNIWEKKDNKENKWTAKEGESTRINK